MTFKKDLRYGSIIYEHPTHLHCAILIMKIAGILWNTILAAIGLWAGFCFLPRVYQQAHFQFSDPRGGNSMWPATFSGILYVASLFICLLALSWIFNRKLSAFHRVVAIILSVLLFAGWLMNAYLSSEYMPHFNGPFRPSFLSSMIGFDGLLYMMPALFALIISAIYGRGPIGLLVQRYGKKA